LINQTTGSQALVEFSELRQRVVDKMKEYNLGQKQSESVTQGRIS